MRYPSFIPSFQHSFNRLFVHSFTFCFVCLSVYRLVFGNKNNYLQEGKQHKFSGFLLSMPKYFSILFHSTCIFPFFLLLFTHTFLFSKKNVFCKFITIKKSITGGCIFLHSIFHPLHRF